MKTALFTLSLALAPILASAQTDSTKSVILSEVEIQADTRFETATHSTLIPKAEDVRHSANAFDLLEVMHVAGLNVDAQKKALTTALGQEVVLCIDGVEVSATEWETLRSKNVRKIELVHNPDGKYSGKGAVVNIVTKQQKYGGNVYLSARESFIFNSGEYIASADCNWGRNRLSVTYSNDWQRSRNEHLASDLILFADASRMTQDISGVEKQKSMTNVLNLRWSQSGENHVLSIAGAVYDDREPYRNKTEKAVYRGANEATTDIASESDTKNQAAYAKANYTLWLPKNQVFDMNASLLFGRNRYNFTYTSPMHTGIQTITKENNVALATTLQYFKTFDSGWNLATILNYAYSGFNDEYTGSLSNETQLYDHESSAKIQLSRQTEKLYGSANIGLADMYTKLNGKDYNYIYPTAFYSLNYVPRSSLSTRLSGFFVYTTFDPSNKNNVVLPTSFFEAVCGNPDIKPIKVFSNTFETDYRWKKSSVSLSYMNYIYFDNIVHAYTSDSRTLYDTKVNDGNFYGNMLTLTYSGRLFKDHLRYSLTCIGEHNAISGDLYHLSRNILRGKLRIEYLNKGLLIGGVLSTPYTALDIREPYNTKKRIDASLHTSYNYKDWRFEIRANNLLNKFDKTRNWMNYNCFDMSHTDLDQSRGRSIVLKLVCNFGYGKKSEKEETTVDKMMKSAILRGK